MSEPAEHVASAPRRRSTSVTVTVTVTFAAAVVSWLAAAVPGAASAPGAGEVPPLVVAIEEQSFGVGIGQPMTFALTLGGESTTFAELAAALTTPGTGPSPPGTLVVTVHRPVSDQAQLDEATAGDPGPALDSAVLDLAAVVPTSSIDAATTSARGSVTVATGVGDGRPDDGAITVAEPGVHPVTIAVEASGATLGSASTFVDLHDPTADATDSTMVAILAGVADPGPWPTAAATTAAQAQLAAAVELAAAVDGPLTLRLPPTLLDSAVEPGADINTDAPSGSTPTVSAVGSAADTFEGDELLAQPSIPLDPSAIAAIDDSALFTTELVAGERTLRAAMPLSARTRSVWVTDDPLTADGASMLRDLGVQLVVFPAADSAELGVGDETTVFEIALSGDALPALVADELGHGLSAVDPGSTAAVTAARITAELQLRRFTAGVPALAMATADLAVPDPAVTAAFVRYASELPGVSVVAASDLVDAVGRTLGSTPPVSPPEEPATDLSARRAAIDAEAGDADAARSMLVDQTDADEWDRGFDQLLARTIDDEEAATHLADLTAEIDGVLGAIVAPEPYSLTLTGTTSDLPITVTNTADQALQVIVRVRSAKLTAAPQPPAIIPAGQSVDVQVPVTARSNGTFTIEVDILTPNLQRVAGPVALKANVRRVSGLSQVVTAGAVLALASWWFSQWRRSRRARLATTASQTEALGADGLSPDAAEAQAGAAPEP